MAIQAPQPLQYRAFPLAGNHVTVGRSAESTIELPNDDVSRVHASLTRDGNAWLLEDRGSTNGTFVEGERIEQRLIRPGHRFQLAKCEFILLEETDPLLEQYRRYFDAQRRDAVTGLPNQDALDDALATRARPPGTWLILLEIGALDRLNRAHGRNTGDDLLRTVAHTLCESVGDVPCFRLEGGRFAVLQGGVAANAHAPEPLAERLVARIGEAIVESRLPWRAELHAGIGVAGESGISSGSLQRAADLALGKATRLGTAQIWTETAMRRRPSVTELRVPPAGEATGVFQLETFFTKHRQHELEDCLRRGWSVAAVTIDGRQALRLSEPALLAAAERALDAAVRQAAVNFHGRLEVGEADDIFFLAGPSADTVNAAVADAEKRFAESRRDGGLSKVRLLAGPSTEVDDPSVALASAVQRLDRAAAGQASPHARLPLPVGHALRAIDGAPAASRFFALMRLHQALSRWLFSVFAAELVRVSATRPIDVDARLDTWLDRPVSERHWVVMARQYHRVLARLAPDDLVLPDYVAMVDAHGEDVFRVLEAFAEVRNKVVHGQHSESPRYVAEWEPRLRALLDGPLRALRRAEFRYVTSVELFDEGAYDVHYKLLSGDNLTLPTYTARQAGAAGLIQDRILVASGDRYLSLTPFALYLRCPTCDTDEVFFLDQLDRRAVFTSLRDGGHSIDHLGRAGRTARQVQLVDDAIDRVRKIL